MSIWEPPAFRTRVFEAFVREQVLEAKQNQPMSVLARVPLEEWAISDIARFGMAAQPTRGGTVFNSPVEPVISIAGHAAAWHKWSSRQSWRLSSHGYPGGISLIVDSASGKQIGLGPVETAAVLTLFTGRTPREAVDVLACDAGTGDFPRLLDSVIDAGVRAPMGRLQTEILRMQGHEPVTELTVHDANRQPVVPAWIASRAKEAIQAVSDPSAYLTPSQIRTAEQLLRTAQRLAPAGHPMRNVPLDSPQLHRMAVFVAAAQCPTQDDTLFQPDPSHLTGNHMRAHGEQPDGNHRIEIEAVGDQAHLQYRDEPVRVTGTELAAVMSVASEWKPGTPIRVIGPTTVSTQFSDELAAALKVPVFTPNGDLQQNIAFDPPTPTRVINPRTTRVVNIPDTDTPASPQWVTSSSASTPVR